MDHLYYLLLWWRYGLHDSWQNREHFQVKHSPRNFHLVHKSIRGSVSWKVTLTRTNEALDARVVVCRHGKWEKRPQGRWVWDLMVVGCEGASLYRRVKALLTHHQLHWGQNYDRPQNSCSVTSAATFPPQLALSRIRNPTHSKYFELDLIGWW